MNLRTVGFLLVGLTMVAWAMPVGAQVVLKIGYVDYQKIVEEWPQAKQRIAEFETRKDKILAELDAAETDLKEEKEILEGKMDLMTDEEAKTELREGFQAKVRESMLQLREREKEIAEERQKVMDQISMELKSKVQDVAEMYGYSLILRKSDLVYAVKDYDITDQVLEELKKE